jgi:tetratricopeptide (TPR) repeat protein
MQSSQNRIFDELLLDQREGSKLNRFSIRITRRDHLANLSFSDSTHIFNEISELNKKKDLGVLILTLPATNVSWIIFRRLQILCDSSNIILIHLPLTSSTLTDNKNQLKALLETLAESGGRGTLFITNTPEVAAVIANALVAVLNENLPGSSRPTAVLRELGWSDFLISGGGQDLLTALREEWTERRRESSSVDSIAKSHSQLPIERSSAHSEELTAAMSSKRHHILRLDLETLTDLVARGSCIGEISYLANMRTSKGDLLWIFAVDDSGNPILGGVTELGSEADEARNNPNSPSTPVKTSTINSNPHRLVNLQAIVNELRVSVRMSSNENIVKTGPINWKLLESMSELPPQSAALVSCFLPESELFELLGWTKPAPTPLEPPMPPEKTTTLAEFSTIFGSGANEHTVDLILKQGKELSDDLLSVAIDSLNEITAILPDDFNSWLLLGHFLFRARRYEDSIAVLNRAQHLRPDESRAGLLRQKAERLKQRDEFLNLSEPDVTDYRRAYKAGILNFEESLFYAELEASEGGDLSLSFKVGEALLVKQPTDIRVRRLLGRNELRIGNLEEATSHFERIVMLGSESAEIHFLLGQCHEGAGQSPKASFHYRQSWQLDNDFTPAIFEWGARYAKSVYRSLDIKQSPFSEDDYQDSSLLRFYRTVCLLSDDRRMEAISMIRKAEQKRDPLLETLKHFAGYVLGPIYLRRQLGELKNSKARNDSERFSRLNSKADDTRKANKPTLEEPEARMPRPNETLWDWRDFARRRYRPSGDFQSEQKRLVERIERDPTNPKKYFDLGDHFFLRQKYDKALHWYERALKHDGTNPMILFHIAKCWRELRNQEKEMWNYRSALESDPSLIPVKFAVGTLYANQLIEGGEIEDLLPFEYLDHVLDFDEGDPVHLLYMGLYFLSIENIPEVERILSDEAIFDTECENLLLEFMRYSMGLFG